MALGISRLLVHVENEVDDDVRFHVAEDERLVQYAVFENVRQLRQDIEKRRGKCRQRPGAGIRLIHLRTEMRNLVEEDLAFLAVAALVLLLDEAAELGGRLPGDDLARLCGGAGRSDGVAERG